MRTTVTLDPDVASKLKQKAKDEEISFKEALNSSVRRGLVAPAPRARPYRVQTRDLGVRPGVNLEKALALADRLEDAETVRKLALRK